MEIIKSFRKTITLKVDRDWKIIVKAPYFTTAWEINRFIKKHDEWINKRKIEIRSAKKSFSVWEKLFYLWEEYDIVYCDITKKITLKWNDIIIPENFRENIDMKLCEFYKKEAKEYIWIRLENISAYNGLDYNNFRITSANTRWGSCSSKKNLNFTFRLIMAPKDVIDYVIIHELAHLKHMNHSKNFRAEVQKMSEKIWVENYKVHKKWLRDHWNKISYV